MPEPRLPSNEEILSKQQIPMSELDKIGIQTATSGNLSEPKLPDNNNFLKVDAGTVADLYPIHQLTGEPMGKLYANHEYVKQAAKQQNDIGLLNQFGASLRYSDLELRKSWLGWQMMIGNLDPTFEEEINKINAEQKELLPKMGDHSLMDRAVRGVAGIIPSMWDTAKYSTKGGLLTGMSLGGASAFVNPVLVPAMTLAGFTAGTAAFGAKHIAEIEAGASFMALSSIKDKEGNPIDQRIVKAIALSVGAINGALESVQVTQLLKTIPGLDKVMSKVVKDSVVKLIKDGSLAKYLLSASKRYAKFLSIETGQEILQEITQMIGEETGRQVHEKTKGVDIQDHLTIGKAVDRLVDTAIGAGTGFFLLGAPGHFMMTTGGIIDHRSQVKMQELAKLLPPDKEVDFTREFENTYSRIKHIFFTSRDSRLLRNTHEIKGFNERIAGLTEKGQDPKELAIAMQLYRDSKNNPEAVEAALTGEKVVKRAPTVEEMYLGITPTEEELTSRKKLTEKQKLNPTQLKLIEMSKNLTKEQMDFVNEIGKIYDEIATEALGPNILTNTINNFVGRSWILKNKKSQEALSKLTTTTIHAKERRIPTIVEGWVEGLQMKSHGIADNLGIYRESMIRTIEQHRLINLLRNAKTPKGNPLLSTEKLHNYEKVDMPQYSLPKGKGGAQFTLFAPRKVARNLNNIFGRSKLYEVPGVEALTKFNAIMKAIALSSSFFHNIAFFRSYYLGGESSVFKDINPITAHREGVAMIRNLDPIVELAVGNGLTLGLIQDWENDLVDMRSDIDKITSKYTSSRRLRNIVLDLWQRQVNYTFGVQGAGLKIKAFAYEFMSEYNRHPEDNINAIASRVAKLINRDFGGLHLERIGRNPTLQHIFRLVALAPDWTESNIQTVTGMFKGKHGAKHRALYQRFWLRVVLRTTMATAMMNFVLAGGDLGAAIDRWKQGVKSNWKNVASIDITPIYNLFGLNPRDRKYFSVMGHFLDPFKYIHSPSRAVQYKMSMVGRLATDWIFQHNWQGKRFKNLGEIPSDIKDFMDFFDPDTYVSFSPASKRGDFIDRHFSFPAYLAHSILTSSPIALQNFLAAASGEISAMDAVMNTIGIRQRKPIKKRRRGRIR